MIEKTKQFPSGKYRCNYNNQICIATPEDGTNEIFSIINVKREYLGIILANQATFHYPFHINHGN